MRRSSVTLVAGAAATAAVLGGLAPFTGQLLGTAGRVASAVIGGPPGSPPTPRATVKVQAASVATSAPPVTRSPTVPHSNGGTVPRWVCTIMEMAGTSSGPLEIRAWLTSGYAASVTVNFSDNQGDIFPPVTYPVDRATPYTLWEGVPPGDIGASAEPTTCTAR